MADIVFGAYGPIGHISHCPARQTPFFSKCFLGFYERAVNIFLSAKVGGAKPCDSSADNQEISIEFCHTIPS